MVLRSDEPDVAETEPSTPLDHARLVLLQSLTRRLARLDEPAEIARVMLEDAVAAVGARTGSLCLLSDAGAELEISAAVGYPDDVLAGWGRFAVDDETPAGECVLHARAIYIPSLDELTQRYPVFRHSPIVGDEALAVVALQAPNRGVLGAAVFGYESRRTFAAAERRFLEALGEEAAAALERAFDRLELERARRVAEERRRQLAFVAVASARLANSLELDATLRTVVELGAPRLADHCALYLADAVDEVAVAIGPDPVRDEVSRALSPAPASVRTVLRNGQILYVAGSELAGGEDDAERPRETTSPLGAGLLVPLRARGALVGVLALVNDVGRELSEDDRRLGDELAARAAVAIDNARLFERETHLARRLEASLLPSRLEALPGLDLAARYISGAVGLEIGGDFYDCFALDDGHWLISVGDVEGRGVEAAALTGLARHTIRSFALLDARPGAILAHLNEVLCRRLGEFRTVGDLDLSVPRFCTAAVIHLTQVDSRWRATMSSAAHPVPLLRAPDGVVTACGKPGLLLGYESGVRYDEVSAELAPGTVLVCVTDGVTERRLPEGRLGLEGLSAVLAAAIGGADQIAEAIIGSGSGSGAGARARPDDDQRPDDMVVFVAQVR